MRKIALQVFIAIGLVFQLACAPTKKEADKEATTVATKKRLPPMPLLENNGTKLFANELVGKKIMLVFFQPDCDHCQAEGKKIQENIDAFSEYTVYFISSAVHEEIKKYAQDLKLDGVKNFHFATTSVQSIIDNYGPISAPSVYIYSKKGNLLSSFNGQTEIDTILKAL